METSNKIGLAIVAVFSAIMQGCIDSVQPVLYAIIIFSIITIIDLATGIQASKKEGKTIESRPMRKCFQKWLIYLSVFVGTLIIGVILSKLAAYNSAADEHTARGLLLNIIKWEAYIATYIELLSIAENLHRWFPESIFLSIIYYVLSVQIKSKIPMVKEYFEQKKLSEDKSTINTPEQ
jgi:Holin family.